MPNSPFLKERLGLTLVWSGACILLLVLLVQEIGPDLEELVAPRLGLMGCWLLLTASVAVGRWSWPNRCAGCLLTLAWAIEPDALFASGGKDAFVITLPIWLATLPATASAAGSYLWLLETSWLVTLFTERYRDARVPTGSSHWALNGIGASAWTILVGIALVGWARADQAMSPSAGPES